MLFNSIMSENPKVIYLLNLKTFYFEITFKFYVKIILNIVKHLDIGMLRYR